MKTKKFKKALKQLGFSSIRNQGKHEIWTNGSKKIPVPSNHNEINKMLCKRILKEAKEA